MMSCCCGVGVVGGVLLWLGWSVTLAYWAWLLFCCFFCGLWFVLVGMAVFFNKTFSSRKKKPTEQAFLGLTTKKKPTNNHLLGGVAVLAVLAVFAGLARFFL